MGDGGVVGKGKAQDTIEVGGEGLIVDVGGSDWMRDGREGGWDEGGIENGMKEGLRMGKARRRTY